MKWYHYVAAFLAGLFLANSVPHFVNGVSGNAFPSPFSHPPGKGLSSPLINVLWGLFNLLVGYGFFLWGQVSPRHKGALLAFFVSFVLISVMLSLTFVDKARF